MADLYYWEDKEQKFVIARGTTLKLTEDWKQENENWKTKSIKTAHWKKDHSIRMYAEDGQVRIYNRDNQRAESTTLCKLPEDIYTIEGPGAKAHEEEDRVRILEMQLKEETKKRKEAEAQAAEERDNRTAEKLKARFKDLELEGVSVHRPFHSNHASGIHLTFEAAEIILYNLESLDDEDFLKRLLIKSAGVCSWEELVAKFAKNEKKAS